jgi:tetratricopeptide (TPR) repeat protein
MDKKLRESIFQEYQLRETSDLLEFWNTSNLEDWENEVFEVVQEILIERHVPIPKPSKKRQAYLIFKNAIHLIENGELQNAKNEINQAIKIDSERAQFYITRAEINEQIGEFEFAIKDYQAAIDLDDESKIAWKNMLNVEKLLNDKFERSEVKQHLVRGLESFYEGEIKKANSECRIAKLNLPPIAIAYNFYGLIMAEMGFFEKALDSFNVAVKLNARFIAGWSNLRYINQRIEEEKYISIEIPDIASSQNVLTVNTQARHEEPITPNEAEVELLPQWAYSNLHALILTGWPGHRNRLGRSGNDPIDIYAEESHIDGIIFRKLIGFKFRTMNPVYLLFMTLTGLVLCLPLFLLIPSLLLNPSVGESHTIIEIIPAVLFLLNISPYLIVGLLVLINVGLSFKHIYQHGIEDSPDTFF